MSEPIVTTVDEPAPMSPLTRFIRTALQVAIALAAAVPTLAAIFDVSAEQSAKLAAGMGVLVSLVSAAHNAYNSRQAATTERDRGQSTIYVVVATLVVIALCLYIFGRR